MKQEGPELSADLYHGINEFQQETVIPGRKIHCTMLLPLDKCVSLVQRVPGPAAMQ